MKNFFILTTFLTISLTVINAELTAKIVSCSGWSLNRLPRLKNFLKGDTGAVTYRNVEIEFIRGKQANMSIMQDGQEIENIVLSEYDKEGEEAIHALFQEKGFEQLSEEELKAKFDARDEEEREEERQNSDDRRRMEEIRLVRLAREKEAEERRLEKKESEDATVTEEL